MSEYTSRVHEYVGSLRHQLSKKTSNHHQLFNMISSRIESAQRFHIGDVTRFAQDTESLLPCEEKFAAPFPLLAVEASNLVAGGHHIYLIEHLEDDDYNLIAAGLSNDTRQWHTAKPVTVTALPGGQFELTTESKNPPEAFDHAVAILRRFQLATMANGFVKTEVTKVPAKQTTKSKLGRTPPIYSHKVLTLTPRAERKGDGLGTHASPRVHLRRGHYRTLRSGRRVWVKPSTVGDKSRGIVTKDYAVKPAGRRAS